MEEILLDDSDDEFYPSPSSRPRRVAKRKADVKKVKDTVLDESESKPSPRSTTKKKGTINEEKVKSILGKVLSKSNSSKPPVLTRSSSLSGKENGGKTTPRAGVGSPKRSSSVKSPAVRQKLSTNWSKAQTELAPYSSEKKILTIDDDDDDDFVDDTKSKGKGDKKAKISKNRQEKKKERESVDLTVSSLDTTLELEDDIETDLMMVDRLKKLFDAQSESNSSSFKSRKSSVRRSMSRKLSTASKKRKVSSPVVINRGPVDCLDNLITETIRGFPCRFCEEEPKKRREIIHHLQTVHDEKLSSEQRNKELAGLFTCEDCGMIVHSRFVLRTHKKAHRKIKEDLRCDVYYKYYLERRLY